jgi:TetR/AcrR family transcriptional repressor of nem operon
MPPKKTVRRAQAAEPKREALVLAAYRLLADRGFEGLRTRDVAGAVGVNIATLHYYFPAKEDLIRGVVAHAMERFRSTLSGDNAPAKLLRAHFDGIRRLARDEPELFAVMGELALRARRDAAMSAIVRETDTVWHATLRGLLRSAQRDGAVDRSLEPNDAAAVIVATLKGTYLLPAGAGPERVSQALRQLERWLSL